MKHLLFIVIITILGAIDTVKIDTAMIPIADMPDTGKITINSSIDPFLNQVVEEDIFESQISEAKSIIAEAIMRRI